MTSYEVATNAGLRGKRTERGSLMETTRSYTVVIEPDEDGVFVATVPAIPGVVDQGDTEEEALENIRQALDFTLTDMLERGEEIPPSDIGRFVVREVSQSSV